MGKLREFLILLGARKVKYFILEILSWVMATWIWIIMPFRLYFNAKKKRRYLEIGPGEQAIEGFETLNIIYQKGLDYIWDATKTLPFKDETFDVIYASHILEHVPWYMLESVLKEWVRVLKKEGRIEIWVPDGLKICEALIDAEKNNDNKIHLDGWYKFNPEKDPCVWASGRIFTYGNGGRKLNHPNWHRALLTERYLESVFEKIGLNLIRRLESKEVRGYDHGWINLGMMGVK